MFAPGPALRGRLRCDLRGLRRACGRLSRRLGSTCGGLVALIVINLVLSVFVAGIDWRAHVGGLIAGMVVPARSPTRPPRCAPGGGRRLPRRPGGLRRAGGCGRRPSRTTRDRARWSSSWRAGTQPDRCPRSSRTVADAPYDRCYRWLTCSPLVSGPAVRDAVIVEARPYARRAPRRWAVRASTRSTCPPTCSRRSSSAPGSTPQSSRTSIWGCVSQVGEQAVNVGRSAVLAAGWPETVPGDDGRPAVRVVAAGRALRRRRAWSPGSTTSSSPAASSR